jgi:hypothetical protein
MTPRQGKVALAQRKESAAQFADNEGRYHMAYRLWKTAAEIYRGLRMEHNVSRCEVAASRVWRDLSGELPV